MLCSSFRRVHTVYMTQSNSTAATDRHNGSIAACEIVAARKRPQAIIRKTISYKRGFETPFQIGYREQMEAFADQRGIDAK